MDVSAALKKKDKPKKSSRKRSNLFFIPLAIIGAVLVAAAFVSLFVNEGKENPVKLVGAALPLDSSLSPPWGINGQLVGISGKAKTSTLLGDNMFLEPGLYLEVFREFEVYSWAETSGLVMRPDENGVEALQMTYTYETKWTPNPHDSLGFTYPATHQNPKVHIEKGIYRPTEILIGLYTVPGKNLALPPGERLTLTDDNVHLYNESTQESRGRRFGNYIYIGKAEPKDPQVGDVRVYYKVVPSGEAATIYGRLGDMSIEPFDKSQLGIFRLEWGGVDESLFVAAREFYRSVWVNRFVGAGVLLLGLLFIVAPALLSRRFFGTAFVILQLSIVFSVSSVLVFRLFYTWSVVIAFVIIAWICAFITGRFSSSE